MTKTEALKLIFTVKAAYPVYYRNVTQSELEAMADIWVAVLSDYTFDECFKAVTGYLKDGNTEIIQSPGQIVSAVKEQEKRDSLLLPPNILMMARENGRIKDEEVDYTRRLG